MMTRICSSFESANLAIIFSLIEVTAVNLIELTFLDYSANYTDVWICFQNFSSEASKVNGSVSRTISLKLKSRYR